MEAKFYIGLFCCVFAIILGTEGSVVLSHVPLAGAASADVSNLNDNDGNTCVDLPQGDQAPWTFKLKMDTVPSGQLVKVVSDGMPCTFQDFFVMVNTTQDESPATAYNKCNLVNVNTAGSKPECQFNCGSDTTDKFTFMQVFNAPTGWKVCGVSYSA